MRARRAHVQPPGARAVRAGEDAERAGAVRGNAGKGDGAEQASVQLARLRAGVGGGDTGRGGGDVGGGAGGEGA